MIAFFKWFGVLVFDPARPVARVVVFGAFGGALGVTAGTILGEISQPWYWMLVPYLALGAGAAFAAVFVLLGIKTEDVYRCCGIALLAGFFWRPVLDAGKDYLLNSDERTAASEASKTADNLDSTIASLNASPTNTALIEKAGRLTDALTLETADLRRGSTKTRAQATTTRALDLLATHAEKGHPAAVAAVVNVAETAANTGNRAVAEKARAQVVRIPPTTNTAVESRRREIINRLPPSR